MSRYLVLDDTYRVPPTEHSPLEQADLVLRSPSEQGSRGATGAFTDGLTFSGAAARWLRHRLLEAPDAPNHTVRLTLHDDCCAGLVLYRGLITSDLLEWCSITGGEPAACTVRTTTLPDSAADRALRCLHQVVISQNTTRPDDPTDPGFQYRVHPFIRYCHRIRPTVLHDLILLVSAQTWAALWVLRPLVLALDAVVSVVNGLCAGCIDTDPDNPGAQGLADAYDRLLGQVELAITGCGEGGIAPYVRSYLHNACQACGLELESSLFTDPASPYYPLTWFQLPNTDGDRLYLGSDGRPRADTVHRYFDQNAPTDTAAVFLDTLCQPFRAVWWVENGTTLRVEPHRPPLPWVDLTAEPDRIAELCFELDDRPVPVYRTIEYATDGLDLAGNEARHLFGERVWYGPPALARQTGTASHTLPFGAQRYRGDGLGRDPLETWSWVPLLALMLRSEHDYALYLERGACLYPKLLVHDPASGFDHARVVRRPHGSHWLYNVPMWVASGSGALAKPVSPEATLYPFWQALDPRNPSPELGLRFRVVFRATCAELAAAISGTATLGLRLPLAVGDGSSRWGTVQTLRLTPEGLQAEGTI